MGTTRLVTAHELARVLNVSVDTIWRHTRNNAIPYVKLAANRYRYNQEIVLKYLSLNQQQPPVTQVSETGAVYQTNVAVTYDDYLNLPYDENHKYEVLEGMLVCEPAPPVYHQQVVLQLAVTLRCYFTKMDPLGELLIAPVDVVLSDVNILEPDLLFIAGDNRHIIEERRINGAPPLAIEVISPSSRSRDRIKKWAIYSRLGVKHYWIIDPQEKSVEAYALRNNAYILRSASCADKDFIHPDFPGLRLRPVDIWRS